jgi:hypothetical protein
VTISNRYETLTGKTSEAGPSGVVKLPSPKIRRMPPIVAEMKKIETSFVNAVKAQTNGQSLLNMRLLFLELYLLIRRTMHWFPLSRWIRK